MGLARDRAFVATLLALGLCGLIGAPARWVALALTLLYVLIAGAGPSIVRAGVAGGLTLGVLTQTTRAFGRVEDSFQYLVRSWSTIVSLISIYKRLRAFEATLQDKPLDTIEAEVPA